MARIGRRAVGADRRRRAVVGVEAVMTLGAQRTKLAYQLRRASKNYRLKLASKKKALDR
jgi:hypothetical protein